MYSQIFQCREDFPGVPSKFGDVKTVKTCQDMSRAEETHLCRYSVVIVHNISMLRSQALLTCPGHISTICEAYRQLGPGTSLQRVLDDEAAS